MIAGSDITNSGAPMRYASHLVALGLALVGAGAARAADLFDAPPATLLRAESVTAEMFAGYLTGSAHEYVYNVPGDGSKLSQLDWNTTALALGGRVAVRPLDWLTVRARGWATVAGESDMTDLDWLYGYTGQNSWSHRSFSPNTSTTKAWQADISAAAVLYDAGDLAFNGIAGYRHFTQKWNARGGSYVYSSPGGFRDLAGTFPDNELGIAYQQTWRTPYLGLGVSHTNGEWSVSGELIGSPIAMADDKDHHALRSLVFTEKFKLSGMVGFSGSAEYRFSPVMSLTGRVEYQNYLGAKGGIRVADGTTGTVSSYPGPSAGADSETLLLSLGVKVRL